MIESLIIFVLDIGSRRFIKSSSPPCTVEMIPGTDLIKVTAFMQASRLEKFRDHPGSHVYVSIPQASRPVSNPISPWSLIYEGIFNPFTVGAVDEEAGTITLVARHRDGPMTNALAKLASRPRHSTGDAVKDEENSKTPLTIDGPYGAGHYFPTFSSANFDRVLLVAGGVGSTFIVPIYQSIVTDNPAARVDFVWAVRGAGDATWAVGGQGGDLMADDNVKIYLTGYILPTQGETEEGVELRSLSGRAASNSRKRPDLKKIVDDTFRMGSEERVAVLVCGPGDMGTGLRGYVRPWAMKGRNVWFHNETFGW